MAWSVGASKGAAAPFQTGFLPRLPITRPPRVRSSERATSPEQMFWPSIPKMSFDPVIIAMLMLTIVR